MKFLKCKLCGKIVIEVKGSKCPTKCCGEAMEEIVANTTDAAVEKHVPVVEVNGNQVKVTVGDVIHPMTEPHYIEWIALETNQGYQFKALTPADQPIACFALAEGEVAVAAYENCNLHGLWKKEL